VICCGHENHTRTVRALLRSIPEIRRPCHLLIDCAYEGDETRQLALDLVFIAFIYFALTAEALRQ
jgi:hypothetical protein